MTWLQVLLLSSVFWQKDCIGLFVRWEQRPTCSGGHDHIPDQHNCHAFYHCWGYRLTHKSCGPYLMFNPVTKVCDWPSIVKSVRPVCAKSKTKKHTKSQPSIVKKIEKRSTTIPTTLATTTTTRSTTTTTRRTTTTTIRTTTTTKRTTTTTKRTSTATTPPTTASKTVVKGVNRLTEPWFSKQTTVITTTTKVPKWSFPKNSSKITFIKPVTIKNASYTPFKKRKPKPKRKVKKKPMNSKNEIIRGNQKSVFGYNSFFDISSLKVFTRDNVTSITP